MDVNKLLKWIDNVLYEDEDKMHPGSLQTLCDVKKELRKTQQFKESVDITQQTQPAIPINVVKELICDWVGPCAMEEISKLLTEYVEQQVGE